MRLALPSLPSRRVSRRQRVVNAGTKALKGGFALKAVGLAARRTRTALAFPLLGVGALILFLRRRLRARREGTFDTAVTPPAPVTEAPRPAAADPSPENPETDLPTAPNGGATSDEDRETAKAAVADRDAPNEGAPGHEPS
jgi:hypothetical protein